MKGFARVVTLLAGLLVLAAPGFADRDEDEDDEDEGDHSRRSEVLRATTTKPTPPKTAVLRQYTLFDVAAHATVQDGWIIVSEKVYDISGYSSHSGGDVFILGGDNTLIYQKGHGTDVSRLSRFLIGTLAP